MSDPGAFLFDLDGTLYSGGAAIPGATELLARLRARAVPFRCITNTTSRPRSMIAERLKRYGLDIPETAIFTATLAGAELARRRGHRVVAPFISPATMVDLGDLQPSGGCSGPATSETPPTAVIVGDLGEGWSYGLLQEAFEHLMRGAELIALSRDRYWRRGPSLALDAGPFVAALEYATGREATLAGKPSPAFFAAAAEGLEGHQPIVVVGDDMWSDIRGAQEAGFAAWLVQTGKFSRDALDVSGITPDRLIPSVAQIVPA